MRLMDAVARAIMGTCTGLVCVVCASNLIRAQRSHKGGPKSCMQALGSSWRWNAGLLVNGDVKDARFTPVA